MKISKGWIILIVVVVIVISVHLLGNRKIQ